MDENTIQKKMNEIKERSEKTRMRSRKALNEWKKRFYDAQLRETAIKELEEE